MRKFWVAPLTALIVAAAALAQAQPKTESGQTGETGFVRQALKSGEEYAALAKLAAEKAQSSDVKQFARMLVSDHTQVNEQLRLLAQRNGAAPAPRDGSKRGGTDTAPQGASPPAATAPGAAPTSPEAARLGRLGGAEFDRQFLAIIAAGHEKSVELYTGESEKGTNPAAKKLATETLPKIKEHLQQAKSLRDQAMEKKSR